MGAQGVVAFLVVAEVIQPLLAPPLHIFGCSLFAFISGLHDYLISKKLSSHGRKAGRLCYNTKKYKLAHSYS